MAQEQSDASEIYAELMNKLYEMYKKRREELKKSNDGKLSEQDFKKMLKDFQKENSKEIEEVKSYLADGKGKSAKEFIEGNISKDINEYNKRFEKSVSKSFETINELKDENNKHGYKDKDVQDKIDELEKLTLNKVEDKNALIDSILSRESEGNSIKIEQVYDVNEAKEMLEKYINTSAKEGTHYNLKEVDFNPENAIMIANYVHENEPESKSKEIEFNLGTGQVKELDYNEIEEDGESKKGIINTKKFNIHELRINERNHTNYLRDNNFKEVNGEWLKTEIISKETVRDNDLRSSGNSPKNNNQNTKEIEREMPENNEANKENRKSETKKEYELEM